MYSRQPFRFRLLLAALPLVIVAACATATPTATPIAPTASAPTTARATTAPPTSPSPSATPGVTATAEPSTVPGSPSISPAPTTPASASPSPVPTPTSYPPIAGLEGLIGEDGRFTVLLLGSDARAGLGGERTDTIMVLSVVPSNGRVSVASLPRDVEGIPIARGRTYREKVTGLYQSFTFDGADDEEAAQQTKEALGYAFGTEIDRYVFIGFEGVKKLVDAVGGVDIRLDRRIDDATIQVKPGVRGLHLKKGLNHLDGATALAFARVRKIDTDYQRAARQQILMMAAGEAVRERGLANLPALVEVAATSIRTDIPLEAAPALFELIQRADLATKRKGVLGPRKYASQGSTRFSVVMKPAEVRALFDNWFAPVSEP